MRDVIALAKPRLSLLVMVTVAAGAMMAPGVVHWWPFSWVMVASALLVASANALNCYIERDTDARMHRTATRPLPAGRLEPRVALHFAAYTGAAAVPLLAYFGNMLTAWLGVVAWVFYVCLYTPMKSRSAWALLVGAVPGAMPPMMGWTSVMDSVGVGGVFVFALLFCWQLVHFFAISLYLHEDYQRGGIMAFSVVYGERTTVWGIFVTAVLLLLVTLLLLPLGMAGSGYAAVMLVLGGAMICWALRGAIRPYTKQWAHETFLATIVYLPLCMLTLVLGARLH